MLDQTYFTGLAGDPKGHSGCITFKTWCCETGWCVMATETTQWTDGQSGAVFFNLF